MSTESRMRAQLWHGYTGLRQPRYACRSSGWDSASSSGNIGPRLSITAPFLNLAISSVRECRRCCLLLVTRCWPAPAQLPLPWPRSFVTGASAGRPLAAGCTW